MSRRFQGGSRRGGMAVVLPQILLHCISNRYKVNKPLTSSVNISESSREHTVACIRPSNRYFHSFRAYLIRMHLHRLLFLVVAAAAGPIANPAPSLSDCPGSASVTSSPVVTSPPVFDRRALEARSVITSLPTTVVTAAVSSCVNFADPDNSIAGYCTCSGYSGTLPFPTASSKGKYSNSTSAVAGCAGYSSVTYTSTSVDSALSTISVSGCVNYAAPDEGIGNVCTCSGYDSFLPIATFTTTTNGSTSTSVGCADYSVVYDEPTSTNPYPYTITYSNSAVVAWATTDGYGVGASVGAGASTIIKNGKSLTMEIDSASSINVGTLTGSALFTSVSSALSAGCGTIASGSTITACDVPTITGVGYAVTETEDYGFSGSFEEYHIYDDGEITITTGLSSISEQTKLDALIVAISGSIASSSLIPNNSWVAKHGCDVNGLTGDVYGCSYTNYTNAGGWMQAIYTSDVDNEPASQNLEVMLSFSHGTSEDFLCTANSLFTSAEYYAVEIAGVLAAITGFEWIAAIGVAIGDIDKATKPYTKAASLACTSIHTADEKRSGVQDELIGEL
jgi:hypothetical protein